jgi:hypothetical protein
MMINWFSVVANSLWIVGLSVILAALSYHYWLAGNYGHPLRQELSRPPFQVFFLIGLLLVGAGLALTGHGWWQILPAVGLILACIVALLSLWRRAQERRHPQE